MKVAIIVGTRPEIIKMAPVIRAAQKKRGVTLLLWHTGQHYSYEMDRQIFTDLELPEPDNNLHVGSGSHANQTAKVMIMLEELMVEKRPDIVLVLGDTNTVLGASLAAAKLHIAVGHIEAGLRSYDRTMPEEINRIACDHIADILYPPTADACATLEREGIATQKIVVTGNTVVDAVWQSLELAQTKSTVLSKLSGKPYIFFTMHRAENVDDRQKLTNVLRALEKILDEHKGIEIVWAVHPRTQKQLEVFRLADKVTGMSRITTMQPQGYLDTLLLQSNALVIMTDSGGMQEEACILGVPCITLRENTERPESVAVGANELVGTSVERITTAANRRIKQKLPMSWSNPFGEGVAGSRIVADVHKRFTKSADRPELQHHA